MRNILLLPIFLLAALGPALSQNRLHVSPLATGQNNGSSWTDAFTDLQDALAAAQPGDEVWVAEGEYKPTAGTARDISFEVKSGVALYGGFAGTETALSQRDWAAHPTVLSGDIGAAGDSTDNSYTILYMENPEEGTVLDGLTLRHGQADNLNTVNFGDRGNSGAALYIMARDDEAYPDIRNCFFERNYAYANGGAVYVNGSGDGSVAPRFLNCVFRHNHARRDGGALYRDGGSWVERAPDFGHCLFEGNWTNLRGGAIMIRDAERADTLQVANSTFIGNQTVAYGGAIFVQPRNATCIQIDSCWFEKNRYTPQGSGGGHVLSHMAAVGGISSEFLYFFNCVFSENGGSTGGAVVHSGSTGTPRHRVYENCLFLSNTCRGNVLSFNSISNRVNNCVFKDNKSDVLFFNSSQNTVMNNVVFSGNESIDTLLLLAHLPRSITINNALFINNKGINPRYFLVSDLDVYRPTLNNCVFYGNETSGMLSGSPFGNGKIRYRNCAFRKEAHPSLLFDSYNIKGVTLEHCYFDSLDCTALTKVTCDGGMVIGGDPMLIAPGAGDFRLHPCSPLRNAGLNISPDTIPTDLAGTPRIQDGTVDIGAYETPAFALAAEPDVKAACAGLPDGAIALPLVGECPPLAFEWQSGPLSGDSLSGLAPGNYLLTVTDAKGNSLTASVTVPAAPAPTLQVDGQPISCFGAADAMLSVRALTGKPPFAYLWSPTGTTDSLDANLGPGPASVTVTDDWGCTATFSFDIPEPDTLQFAATVTRPSTPQSADGGILVNSVTGGTPPYAYLWEPGGSMESVLAGLSEGAYTLTVTDARGCEAAWTFEVKALVGVTEAEGVATLVIWPNPAGESAWLRWEGAMPALLEMYDAQGRLVRSEKVSPAGERWRVPLEGLAAGAYAVVLRDGHGKAVGAGRLLRVIKGH